MIVADHAHTETSPVEAGLASKAARLFDRVECRFSSGQIPLGTVVMALLADHGESDA